MKVTGYGTIRQASSPRRRGSADATGDFASLLDHVGEGQAAVPVQGTGAVALDGILSAQEITDEELRRRKAMKSAFGTLEILETIRLSLLSGRLSPPVIAELADAASRQLAVVSDPGLQSVLADIELRAAVELAKLEKAMETKK